MKETWEEREYKHFRCRKWRHNLVYRFQKASVTGAQKSARPLISQEAAVTLIMILPRIRNICRPTSESQEKLSMFSHQRRVGAWPGGTLGCEVLDGSSVALGRSGRMQLLRREMMIVWEQGDEGNAGQHMRVRDKKEGCCSRLDM